jgi:hypothetical protein
MALAARGLMMTTFHAARRKCAAEELDHKSKTRRKQINFVMKLIVHQIY